MLWVRNPSQIIATALMCSLVSSFLFSCGLWLLFGRSLVFGCQTDIHGKERPMGEGVTARAQLLGLLLFFLLLFSLSFFPFVS